MSAVTEYNNRYACQLASMTDAALKGELEFWNAEITCRYRWGDAIAAADEARGMVECEIRSRRKVALMVGSIEIRPITLLPVIEGTAKERAARKPGRALIGTCLVAAAICLSGATALAGKSVLEMEGRLEARARV